MQTLILSGIRYLFVLGIVFIFLGSTSFLALMGFVMGDENAGFLQRIHPSFYLCMPLICIMFLSLKNTNFKIIIPKVLLDGEFKSLSWKSFSVYALVVVLSIVFILLGITEASLINTATTFLLPVICIIGLLKLKKSELLFLRNFVIYFLLFNSILGIIENFTGYRMFPYMIFGGEKLNDPRPTAWFSHPLNNALITSLILIYFIYSKTTQNSLFIRYLSIFIHGLALTCFGGRAALVVLVFVIFLNYIRTLLKTIMFGKEYKSFILQTVGLMIGIIIILYLHQFGIFDNILLRFEDDGGSADVRWGALDLIVSLDFSRLVFGISQDEIESLLIYYRLYTIEFSWLYILLKHGVIMGMALLLSMCSMLYYLSKTFGRPIGFICFAFLIITFGYTSIASVSLILVQLMLIIFLLKEIYIKNV